MKLLVTGSKGFIGKRLVEKLKKQGHQVSEFDRSNNQDVLNQKQLGEALNGMNAVFHLAASIDEHDPKLIETNVSGTKNVLETASKQQIEQFIFLSTVGVMGNISGVANEQTPLNPVTPYEQSKAQAEEMVLSYQEVLPITIVRSALVMGPNNEWRQIIKTIKKDFPLIGEGKNFWQTVFVNDLVDALTFLLNNEKAIGETFIVSQEQKPTLLELVKMIRKEIGMGESVKTIPVFAGKAVAQFLGLYSKISGKKTILLPEHVERLLRTRNYSIEKIKKIGWKPKYSMEQAVKETIKNLEVQNK